MEVTACLKLLFCWARTADQDTLEPFEEVFFGEVNGARPFPDFGIELVDRDLTESPEPGGGLTAFPLLAGYR